MCQCQFSTLQISNYIHKQAISHRTIAANLPFPHRILFHTSLTRPSPLLPLSIHPLLHEGSLTHFVCFLFAWFIIHTYQRVCIPCLSLFLVPVFICPILLSFARFLLLRSFIQPTQNNNTKQKKKKVHGLPFPSLCCLCQCSCYVLKMGLDWLFCHPFPYNPHPHPSSPAYCTLFPPPSSPSCRPPNSTPFSGRKGESENERKKNMGSSPALALIRQTTFRHVHNDAYVWTGLRVVIYCCWCSLDLITSTLADALGDEDALCVCVGCFPRVCLPVSRHCSLDVGANTLSHTLHWEMVSYDRCLVLCRLLPITQQPNIMQRNGIVLLSFCLFHGIGVIVYGECEPKKQDNLCDIL